MALRKVPFTWLSSFEFLLKLLRGQVNFSEYLSNKGTSQIAAWVVWQGGRSAIWMAIENVTSFLSHRYKSNAAQ